MERNRGDKYSASKEVKREWRSEHAINRGYIEKHGCRAVATDGPYPPVHDLAWLK